MPAVASFSSLSMSLLSSFRLDLQTISNLKTQMRMLVGAEWTDPAGPYKNVVELWDGEVPEENLRLL